MLLTTPAESLQATLPVLMDVLGSEVAVAAMEVSVEFNRGVKLCAWNHFSVFELFRTGCIESRNLQWGFDGAN